MNIDLSNLRIENEKLRQKFKVLKYPFQQLTFECEKAHSRITNSHESSIKIHKNHSKINKPVKTSTSIKNLVKLLEVERTKKEMLISKIARFNSLMEDVNVITIFELTYNFIQLSNLYNIITIFNTSSIGDICMDFCDPIHFKIIIFTQPNSSRYNQKQQIFFCTAQSFNISVEKNRVTMRTTEKKEEWFTRKKCISCKTQFSFKDWECSNKKCIRHSNFCEFMNETVTIEFSTPFLSMRVIGDSNDDFNLK
jgi:hypothetical protein